MLAKRAGGAFVSGAQPELSGSEARAAVARSANAESPLTSTIKVQARATGPFLLHVAAGLEPRESATLAECKPPAQNMGKGSEGT